MAKGSTIKHNPKRGVWQTLSGKILKKPELPQPTQMHVLGGLQDKVLYAGTADHKKVAQRRAKNKMAKQSRKVNRASSK